MGRWQPGTKERLQAIALDLFLEQGFEATTVVEIAQRAGVTERTFFRYFGDKREVLFDGQEVLLDRFVQGVRDAPTDASEMDVVSRVLDAAGDLFPASRQDHSRRRQVTIDSTPLLQEREMLKLATLTSALAAAFRDRGTPEPQATLAAETAVTVFRVGFDRWRQADPPRDLGAVQRETLADLRALTR